MILQVITKTISIIILLFCILKLLYAQEGLGPTQLDPGRDNALSPSNKSKPDPSPQSQDTPLPNSAQIVLTRELVGFTIGEFTHHNSLEFSSNLSSEILNFTDSGLKIDMIKIVGFADGNHNGGLSKDISLLPSNCRKVVKNLIYDPELALLRGCIVWDELSKIIEPKYVGFITWKPDEYTDIPDGGDVTERSRKIQVVVSFIRMEEEHE